MTEREKIIKIIEKNGTYNGRSLSFDYYVIQPDDLADALIAAGIGDVKSWEISDADKERSSINYYCEMREWKDKCKETEHRAEVAEKMFNILYEETSEYMKVLSKEWYKYQAEKELEEEKKTVNKDLYNRNGRV